MVCSAYSSLKQNAERQFDGQVLGNVLTDTASVKETKRPKWLALLGL